LPELSSRIADFFNESAYDSFSSIEVGVVKINKFEHLMQRLDSIDIEAMVSSNK